ncbi:hypothetical protein DEU56DRAFT_919419 [Suillus clintonianus]|uniref:uncharacterized protein n=1 Tax=Suillus clintonianus TaxID=1904413 RepID=UPI001B863222|nr:uncharacterized protein DEU56DRAFT_919419 [Suillus clintonianus]KAG2115449.1 hypothetical protein DEU56DRAFT_919419 [Suillus clintonianus]
MAPPSHVARSDNVPSPSPTSRSRSRSLTPNEGDQPKHQTFLQAAKLEMRLQAVLTHPIPEHRDVVALAQEVLDAELWKYHSKKIRSENGYFPEYHDQMSRFLSDDLFTFRTEVKKVIISIAKQLYNIFGFLIRPRYKNFVLQVLRDDV